MADLLARHPRAPRRPGLARGARGRRAARGRHREEYELLVEAIYEGYLLHYGHAAPAPHRATPISACSPATGSTRSGLARLVDLGDTLAVAELADTITLSALAQGAGDPDLADAVWHAGARDRRLGPRVEAHEHAKELVAGGRSRTRSRRCAQARATPRRRT